MKVAESIEQVRAELAEARTAGKTIGLVPTMGNLHAGHWSLIQAAREACDFVTVSIFVNPTQFAPGEDWASYPRSPAADLSGCSSRGVDLVFTPAAETMYGRGGLTTVALPSLSRTLCGRSRPTHFDGVCTVVAKLFNIIQPDKAFFGAKDFQQSVIIRRMVRDLNFPVEILVCPTVREADGLAMSSRNAHLTPDQRAQAVTLYASLETAAELIRRSHPPVSEVIAAIRQHLASAAPDEQIDYVRIVDPEDLTDVETTDRPVLIALAVRLGEVRLIDNTLVDAPSCEP